MKLSAPTLSSLELALTRKVLAKIAANQILNGIFLQVARQRLAERHVSMHLMIMANRHQLAWTSAKALVWLELSRFSAGMISTSSHNRVN